MKLCDFGACRPISASGRRRLGASWRVLSDMRNGDWRDADDEGGAKTSSSDDKKCITLATSSLKRAKTGAVWTFEQKLSSLTTTGKPYHGKSLMIVSKALPLICRLKYCLLIR